MDVPKHTLKYQTLYQTDNLHLLLLWGPQLNQVSSFGQYSKDYNRKGVRIRLRLQLLGNFKTILKQYIHSKWISLYQGMNEFRILCRASSAKSSIIFARFLLLLLYIGTQKVPTEQEPFICTFNFQPWQDQQEYKDKFIELCGKYIFIIIICIS